MNLTRGKNAVKRQNRIGWALGLVAALLAAAFGRTLIGCLRF